MLSAADVFNTAASPCCRRLWHLRCSLAAANLPSLRRGFSIAASPSEAPAAESRGALDSGIRPRPEPTNRVKRLAEKLRKLDPKEVAMLRKICRDRLTPLPSGHKGPPPKNYKPKMLPVLRDHRPLPVRQNLSSLGQKISAVHPAWIFAGHGPGILPVPMPQITAAIMAPHAAEMAGAASEAAAASGPIPQMAAAGSEAPQQAEAASEEADTAEEDAKKKEKPAQKVNVTIRLLSVDAKNKLKVIKEVRSMLGLGLQESKQKVESVPFTLKKGVPREEAEKQADKFRALGSEVALE